ncbi:MAG: hypothetical protein U0637_14270 [Phycisphaerales bacterium]
MTQPTAPALRRCLAIVLLAGATSLNVQPAAAQDQARSSVVSGLNEPLVTVDAARRSETVILPLLVKLEAPPALVASVDEARLIPADAKGFDAAAAWAKAAPQQAAIAGLAAVTKEEDWRKAMIFAQPYGSDGVAPALIRAGAYTDLDDPPTLAWAKLGCMPLFSRLETLVNVEATRLVAEDKANDALDLLVNFAYFARQVCDRRFLVEAQWGLEASSRTFERMRDLAYTDARGARKLHPERIKAAITRMNPDGVLDLSRMKFPEGNRAAAEQMVERLYNEAGQIRTDVFPTTMARLGTGGKPLRLFSQSARWRTAAGEQASRVEAASKVRGIYDDWSRRWTGSFFDLTLQGRASLFGDLDRTRYAVVALAMPDMGGLINERQQAICEGVGTRLTLALTAQWYATGAIPPQVTAVRPRWLKEVEADPFNGTAVNRGAVPPPQYFIPTKRGNPVAHSMDVVTNSVRGDANFNLKLKEDTFVLYSFGTDTADNFASRIQNTTQTVQNADYLLYPPVLSLYRQNLRDRGDIQ